MQDKWRKIIDCVVMFSYQEKKKRKFEGFNQEIERLRNLSKDELNFEYIEAKVEYEHKKSVSVLFMFIILLSVLMKTWVGFFSFMEMAFKYAAEDVMQGVDVVRITFMFSVPILLFITLVILFFIFTLLDDMNKLKRKIAIIENIIVVDIPMKYE